MVQTSWMFEQNGCLCRLEHWVLAAIEAVGRMGAGNSAALLAKAGSGLRKGGSFDVGVNRRSARSINQMTNFDYEYA
jgi:hypothetical protein